MDSIPNNTPHPGCTFQVEWYGFDEGSDVVSTVTFAMHSPTKDVGLTVDGPSRVFVGGDPASGAGTSTGIDGRQAYTLSFDGEPHAKQGYHVKLTVATPRSRGNDTKTKVFWVEPCDATRTGTGTEGDGARASGGETGVLDATGTRDGQESIGDTGRTVVTEATGATEVAEDTDVPSTVDAGAGGDESGALSAVTSPAGLLTIALGLLVACGAVLLRRRGQA